MSGDNRPIGIFDSGIGGLTVLHAVGELLPAENLVYLGDTARVPYGTKSRDTVIRYAMEDARFLLSKNVKAVVAACNSAAATSMETLREKLDVPVIGVIEAGVEQAMNVSEHGKIGVIGTYATIGSGRYKTLLRKKGAVSVISQACPLFVPLAEEGWTDNGIALDTARIYLRPFLDGAVDSLILGCTHYPLLEKTIGAVCGESVKLVNSAESVAARLKETLKAENLLCVSGEGKRTYYVTDSPERAHAVGSRFLGEEMGDSLQFADLTQFAE